jgi:rod shape-determining protein MreC
LLPVQRTLAMPVQAVRSAADYLGGLNQALVQRAAGSARSSHCSPSALRASSSSSARTRGCASCSSCGRNCRCAAGRRGAVRGADPFSRKLVIDRGAAHGVVAGAPVVDPDGVLGQVTRVYPLSSRSRC